MDANNWILIARRTFELMNMEAISKDRNFQEHILMINGMKIMLLM